MSRGSLIALSCNTIKLKKTDVLGPIDPQLYGVIPAKTIISILESKKNNNTIEDFITKYFQRLYRRLSTNV